MQSVTRGELLAQTWPIVFGQALIPLVGVVDVAVIGQSGGTGLAAVALGVTIVNSVIWAFGFLRMGATGLTAQADGAGNAGEVQAVLRRSLVLALALGATVAATSVPIARAGTTLLAAPPDVSATAAQFVALRLTAAPATLGLYAVNGWLFGIRRTRSALAVLLIVNATNLVLDVALVSQFSLGVRGIAIGSASADWFGFGAALVIVRRELASRRVKPSSTPSIFVRSAFYRLLRVNGDILVRTLSLIALFAWFARSGAQHGTTQLAANHLLMQFATVSAFILDGFAFTAEARVGAAKGAGDRPAFVLAARLTAELSLTCAGFLTGLLAAGGDHIIPLLTSDPDVAARASAALPFCALIPLLGAPSWLLDGIFIGATETKSMRNATVAAFALYIATDLAMRPLGAAGVWLALLSAYVFRAVTLGAHLPSLWRSIPQSLTEVRD